MDRKQIQHEVHDPMVNWAAVLAARERPMSERLELALSWNSVVAELRAGLAAVKAADAARRRDPGDVRLLESLEDENG